MLPCIAWPCIPCLSCHALHYTHLPCAALTLFFALRGLLRLTLPCRLALRFDALPCAVLALLTLRCSALLTLPCLALRSTFLNALRSSALLYAALRVMKCFAFYGLTLARSELSCPLDLACPILLIKNEASLSIHLRFA